MNWVTAMEFILPQDAYIAKGRLESEGISTLLKDELTIQTDNFLSNAIGGVKLQVSELHLNKARAILIEGGFMPVPKDDESIFLKKIDKLTKKFPLIGNSLFEFRLLVLAALIMISIFILIFLITWESEINKITNSTWCVNNINYKGVEYDPPTGSITITSVNPWFEYCNSQLAFETNGIFLLSNGIEGNWELKDDKIVISEIKEFDEIFNGSFTYKLKGNHLQLKSKNTILVSEFYD